MLTQKRAQALLAGFALNLITSIGSAKEQVAAPESAKTEELVTLGRIDGEVDGSLSTINIRFNREPTWAKLAPVQDHGSFLQLVLPGTLVTEPGKFYDIDTKVIPKVAAVQLTPSDAGLRFFVEHDAAAVKQAIDTETLGNRVVLTIDHNKMQEAKANALASYPAPAEAQLVGPPTPPSVTADQVIASTEVAHDEPAPSERMKAEVKERQSPIKQGFDFQAKLVQVSAFSAVLLAMLLIVKLLKPYTRRRRGSSGELLDDGPVTIKTLASLNLAARQKVSLLQVGGEKILIGVTPENVSFLTTIGAPAVNTQRVSAQRSMPQAMIPDARDFASHLAESAETVTMTKAPVSQTRPTEQTKTAPVKTKLPPVAKQTTPTVGSRINVAISEDGIQPVAASSAKKPSPKQAAKAESPAAPQEAIDDVTRMIREKLKSLRSI